jgi:hypothetical protein
VHSRVCGRIKPIDALLPINHHNRVHPVNQLSAKRRIAGEDFRAFVSVATDQTHRPENGARRRCLHATLSYGTQSACWLE